MARRVLGNQTVVQRLMHEVDQHQYGSKENVDAAVKSGFNDSNKASSLSVLH